MLEGGMVMLPGMGALCQISSQLLESFDLVSSCPSVKVHHAKSLFTQKRNSYASFSFLAFKSSYLTPFCFSWFFFSFFSFHSFLFFLIFLIFFLVFSWHFSFFLIFSNFSTQNTNTYIHYAQIYKELRLWLLKRRRFMEEETLHILFTWHL